MAAALLKQGKFTIRAVTRNAAKAEKLAQQNGVEVVQADLNDKAALVKVGSFVYLTEPPSAELLCTLDSQPCKLPRYACTPISLYR